MVCSRREETGPIASLYEEADDDALPSSVVDEEET